MIESRCSICGKKIFGTGTGGTINDICQCYTTYAKKAWICPRCNRVNAPHVDTCDCEPRLY